MNQFDKDVNEVLMLYGEMPDRHPETREWPVSKAAYSTKTMSKVPFAWGIYCGANGKDHAWWRHCDLKEDTNAYLRGLRIGRRMMEAGL